MCVVVNINFKKKKKFIYKYIYKNQYANTGSCEHKIKILHKPKRNKRHTNYIYKWQMHKYIRTCKFIHTKLV